MDLKENTRISKGCFAASWLNLNLGSPPQPIPPNIFLLPTISSDKIDDRKILVVVHKGRLVSLGFWSGFLVWGSGLGFWSGVLVWVSGLGFWFVSVTGHNSSS